MPISYNKPALDICPGIITDIETIVNSGWVSNGIFVETLENKIKELFNVKYVLACNNATQGLIISLKAAGWRNKRVLAPAFTWPSTVYAIECNTGNRVVFGDIRKDTWYLDPSTIDIDEYDAILAMDTFGNEMMLDTNLPLIYDAAHGFGLKHLGNRKAIAEVVSLSFTKIVTGMEGGLILSNDENFYEVAKELRRLSSRMSEINARLALRSIELWCDEGGKDKREEHVQYYKTYLDFEYDCQVSPIDKNNSVFSILLPSPFVRDSIVEELKRNSIEHKVYYEPLVEGLPVTDMVYSRILSLPVYTKLTEEELNTICAVVNTASKNFTPGKRYLKKSGYLNRYMHREI